MTDVSESGIAALLSRLSTAQEQLLALLSKKRELLQSRNHQALQELASEEAELSDELKACHDERTQLLAQAAEQGLPGDSIRSLAAALPGEARSALKKPIESAIERSKLLQHESLTQWVVVQRSLLHLSQMLEIIATGGRPRPTYEKGRSVESSGALIDRAV